MPGTLDFTRQAALAAGAVTRLAAWANFTGFGNVALQGVHILVVEAFAFRAILGGTAATAATTTHRRGTRATPCAPPTPFAPAFGANFHIAFFDKATLIIYHVIVQ